MKNITLILKSIINEILIIFIFIFLIYIYIGPVDKTIKSDAAGYYDYLPSLFIHHDLIRKDIPFSKDSILYNRITSLNFYLDYGDYKVNKYACGTAVLQLPFFTYTYLTTTLEGNNNDGYQPPFHKAIFYAAIFYLFLSIFFLKKILEQYDIKRNVIIISQFLLVFATSVTNYANYDAGFSHVYSLFAITAFIYFVKSYFKSKNVNHFIVACLFLGLILIIRQINILIILFVPFIAGSLASLKNGFIDTFHKPKKLVIGIFLISGVIFIQCLVWYLQTGKFVIYSYQGENFDFLHPQIFNVLFSYKKGLFVYTPVLFISMFSLIWLAYKRKYYLILTWVSFFLILTYVLSSWHSWYYGAGYGLRAYIDFYAIFFIPLALMLDGIKKYLKIVIIILSFLAIPLNIIQSYQYKVFILRWIDMDKEKYWKVFLKTENRYKGLFWKKNYNYNNYHTVKEFLIGDITTSKNAHNVIYNGNSRDIPDFEYVSIIEVLIDNEYDIENNSKFILSIDDTSSHHNYCWVYRYFIQFSEKPDNVWQTGLNNFEFRPIKDLKEKIITLEVESGNQNNNFKNVRIKYLKHK
jgi:hypothetical protein